MYGKVIRQPCVINWVAWKCAFRIPLTRASLTRLCKHGLNSPANTHLWIEWVGEQRGKSISWILDFIMRMKKQLCCGSFFNDPKSTCMNLLVVAVCLIWRKKWERKTRGELFPHWVLTDHETGLGLSTWIMDSDNIFGQVFLQEQKEAKWIFSFQTHLLQFLLFMDTCKREATDIWSRFNVCVKYYNAIFGCLRMVLFLCLFSI